MKRTLLFGSSETTLVLTGTALIAATYGLVRLAYGLILPDVQSSIGLDDATAGMVSSGASIAYCLGAVLGLGADRHPRRLVVGASVTAAGGSLAMALSPTVATFAPATVVASMGAGLASPAMVALVAESVDGRRRSRSQAVVNTGTGPGLVAVGVLALVLPHWRATMIVAAVLTALAGVAVLRSSGHRPRVVRDGPDGSAAAAQVRRWWVPLTCAVLLGTASAATWTFGRVLLLDQGASASTSTVAWIAIGVGGAAAVLTARTLDRLSAPAAWSVSLGVVTAATAGLAGAAGAGAAGAGAVGAVTACAVFGWSFVAATSALITWGADVSPTRAGAATAAFFVALVVGQAIGSTLLGATAGRTGLVGAFWLAAGTGLLAAVVPALGHLGTDQSKSSRASISSRVEPEA